MPLYVSRTKTPFLLFYIPKTFAFLSVNTATPCALSTLPLWPSSTFLQIAEKISLTRIQPVS